jgi:exopolysaccharide biosynthesis polyprenyl glycosylphosphotransferase
MNNPLELAGQVGRLIPPVRGRVLIVGARRDSRRLARRLVLESLSGMQVVGYVDAAHSRGECRSRQLALHPSIAPIPVLGGVDQLGELVDRAKATHVMIAVSGRPAKQLRPRLAPLSNSDVAVHWLPERRTRRRALPGLADWSATTTTCATSPPRLDRIAKRLVDCVAAAIGLLLLSPLFAVIALLIVVTSGRPVFYTQERVGQWGRIFPMIKFRSMKRDAEGETGPIWASNHDARCTPIGAWLRHTNLDEFPQLINVLLGHMSLVGPRPERPVFVEQFRQTIPDYDLRHAVPGGMTGWAQVHGWRGRTSLRKRVQYDLDYLQRWSFWFDYQVLLMTVQHVLWGKISWNTPRRRPGP